MPRAKKTLDDYRFELNVALTRCGIEDVESWIDKYEKLIKGSIKLTFHYIGPLRVPDEIYRACQMIVPKEVLQRYEQRLVHLLNTSSTKDVDRMKNNITQSFLDLYEEWSNVDTAEARVNYN